MITEYVLCIYLVLGMGSKHFLYVHDRQISLISRTEIFSSSFCLTLKILNLENTLSHLNYFRLLEEYTWKFFNQEFCILNSYSYLNMNI